MSFLESRAHQARNRQLNALIKEARSAGATMLSNDDEINASTATVAGATAGALKGLFGGKLNIDVLFVLRLQTNGWQHVFVQPFSGTTPLPGEHYGLLTGSSATPAILRRGGLLRSWQWDPTAGAELAHYLTQLPGLGAVARNMSWEWPMGFGAVELEWTAQIRALGDGSSQLVMQSGRYGGLTTYGVGFQQWLRLAGQLGPCLHHGPSCAQAFTEPPRFQFLSSGELKEATAAHPPAAPRGLDYHATLRATLAGFIGKRIWLDNIPPTQHRNIYEHVLPPEFRDAPLLAAIDLTTFGSAKDAIAITPTHMVFRDGDQPVACELANISAVGREKMTVVDVVSSAGTFEVPLGFEPKAVIALLSAIATVNDAMGHTNQV